MKLEKIKELFSKELKVINVGLPSFAESLREAGAEVVHVDWRPRGGGKKHIINLLNKIKAHQEKIASNR